MEQVRLEQPEQLTRRERRILELVEHGLTNAEIAQQLWVVEQTVKFHLSRIYKKIGVPNRTAAVKWLHDHSTTLPPPSEDSR